MWWYVRGRVVVCGCVGVWWYVGAACGGLWVRGRVGGLGVVWVWVWVWVWVCVRVPGAPAVGLVRRDDVLRGLAFVPDVDAVDLFGECVVVRWAGPLVFMVSG